MMHFRSSWAVLAAVLIAVFALPALAQQKAPLPKSFGTEGMVMDVRPDAHEVMIQTDDGNKLPVQVHDKTWIKLKDNQDGTLNDLKKGEVVSIIYFKEAGKNKAELITEGRGGAGRTPRKPPR
jgi:hypothetical protein